MSTCIITNSTMEEVRNYLEVSSIDGLHYIASAKRFSTRIFWILIVFVGFIGAFFLIYESFINWEQSPISTTIETLPISQVIFPNVTVCPPKNSYLNLNYDYMQAEKLQIENETRLELFDYAKGVIQDLFYEEIMRNLTKVQDPDRYYNWYHEYSPIAYPYYTTKLWYSYTTYATSGNISTKYFGEIFDSMKLDGDIDIKIKVYPLKSIIGDRNTTFVIGIDKVTMLGLSDTLKVRWNQFPFEFDVDKDKYGKQIPGPKPYLDHFYTHLTRSISKDDISNTEIDMMPGFRLTWFYDPKADNILETHDTEAWLTNKQFIR